MITNMYTFDYVKKMSDIVFLLITFKTLAPTACQSLTVGAPCIIGMLKMEWPKKAEWQVVCDTN